MERQGKRPNENSTQFLGISREIPKFWVLIAVVREAAHKDARHAEWLLERQFPHEFAPYDRRPIPVEPAPEKKISVAFIVDTKGKSLQEVANFPTEQPMAPTEPELEPEPTAGELFDGNIGKLGPVAHDLPFDGNGG
jgi:hypothetical protein